MLKGVQQFLSAIALLCAATLSVAGDPPRATVDLVLPADTPSLQALASGIQQQANFAVTTYIAQPPPTDQAGDILLIISDALLPLLNSPHYAAHFAMYTNSARYADYHHSRSSAVYADQPLSRQLRLIDALLGNRRTVIGMAWQQREYLSQYNAVQKAYPSYRFTQQQVDGAQAERQINRLIQQCDVLLATPESDLYNANSIRSILLAAYRHQTLVIGPDKAFVTAGALASVSSQPQHYIDDIVDSIQYYLRTATVPPPRYPSRFTVSINSHVAESLGIPLRSGDQLLQQMREH